MKKVALKYSYYEPKSVLHIIILSDPDLNPHFSNGWIRIPSRNYDVRACSEIDYRTLLPFSFQGVYCSTPYNRHLTMEV